MTGPKLEHHIRIILTLRALVDGSTYTLRLCNIPFTSTVPTTFYYPLVRSVPEFGAEMGVYMPTTFTTSVTLDDSPGSLGFERRISDLFERYTIINQSVQLQLASGAVGEVVDGDFAAEWYGIVKNWSREGDSVVLQLAGQGLRDRVITKIINSVDFPSAPQSSLGFALPIVFGSSVEVKPVRIVADADASPEYAYATTFHTTYPVGGVQTYYAKAKDGKYYAVSSATTTTTLLYGNEYQAGKNNSGWASPGPVTGYAKAFTTGSSGSIVLNATQRVYKNNIGTPDGSFTLNICEADLIQSSAPTQAPGTVIGSTTYDLSILGGAIVADYDLDFSFPEPIVLRPNTTYYYQFIYQQGAVNYIGHYYDGAVIETGYDFSGASLTWSPNTVNSWGKKTYFRLYGAVFTDTKSSAGNQDGLGHAYVEVTQRASPEPKPDLTKIDFVFAIQGLKDSSGGAISGTNNLLLESPHWATTLIAQAWNGSAWATDQYAVSTHSATHVQVDTATSTYYRKLNGKTNGRARLSDFLAEICRNTACRVTVNSHATTPFGLWVWGSEEASDATITDEDATILRIEELGTETVVNDAEMYYSELVRTVDFITGSAQGEFKNFSANLRYYNGHSIPITPLCLPSYTVYGTRRNANLTYQLIGDSSSAGVVLQYLLRLYAYTHRFVDLEVPYVKFKALALMDVVTIVHPQLPTFFGSASNAALPTYTGTEVEVLQGHYLKRAVQYRAQIESRKIVFDNEQVPKLRLGVRLLLNYGLDPT
jgi:hypothetical protein